MFNEAIGYLLGSVANSVICDILVREKGSIVSWPADVHSVVLYKNPAESNGKYKITVIDPSNFQYSSHLSNDDMKVSCAHPMLDSVITFLAPLQIYKPDGSIGHDASLHRDCVDIATKLSFGFNSNPLSYMLTKEDMKSHPVIVAISNINEVDPAFSGGTLAVRIKQTSDHAAVIHFKKLEDDIFRDLKLLRTIKEEAWKRKDTYDEVFKAAVGQTNYGEFVAIKDSKLSAI